MRAFNATIDLDSYAALFPRVETHDTIEFLLPPGGRSLLMKRPGCADLLPVEIGEQFADFLRKTSQRWREITKPGAPRRSR
jgi:hypothetical protein